MKECTPLMLDTAKASCLTLIGISTQIVLGKFDAEMQDKAVEPIDAIIKFLMAFFEISREDVIKLHESIHNDLTAIMLKHRKDALAHDE